MTELSRSFNTVYVAATIADSGVATEIHCLLEIDGFKLLRAASVVFEIKAPRKRILNLSSTTFGAGRPKKQICLYGRTRQLVGCKFDHSGKRIFTSNFGLPVIAYGNVIDASLDQNNIGAIYAMLKYSGSCLRSASSEIAILLPEINREFSASIAFNKGSAYCEFLGCRLLSSNGSEQLIIERAGIMIEAKINSVMPLSLARAFACAEKLEFPAYSERNVIQFHESSQQHKPQSKVAFLAPSTVRGRARELTILIGGSGEYDQHGHTRIGENLGYAEWLTCFQKGTHATIFIAKNEGLEITIDLIERSIKKIVDKIQPSSVNLIGHSLGGLVAAQLASAKSFRIDSLLLIGTPARGLCRLVARQIFCANHPLTAVPQDRHRLRRYAAEFANSVSAQDRLGLSSIRAVDKDVMREFLEFSPADCVPRFSRSLKIGILHGSSDEKVPVRDAFAWSRICREQGFSVSRCIAPDRDHMLEASKPGINNSAANLILSNLEALRNR